MKLVARRAQMKTDRVCYFCGLPGTITKEHVWPQWQHDDAEVVPKRTLRTVGFRRTADDAFTEMPNVTIERQGSVLTQKVREVCKECTTAG